MKSTLAGPNFARALCLGCVLEALAPSAHADDPPAIERRAPDADPDRPRIALEHRDAVRATLGLTLPVHSAKAGEGWSFDLAPAVELHEPPGSDQLLPSQYWRGLLRFGGDFGFFAASAHHRIGLRVAHESDHETAHAFSQHGFLALNFIEAPWLIAWELGALQPWVSASGRVYVLSCTERSAPCRDLQGSSSAGGQVGVGVRALEPTLFGAHPFAALAVSGIARSGLIRSEHRLTLRAGIQVPVTHGAFEFYLLGHLGHDVGIARGQRQESLGGGVAFTLELGG